MSGWSPADLMTNDVDTGTPDGATYHTRHTSFQFYSQEGETLGRATDPGQPVPLLNAEEQKLITPIQRLEESFTSHSDANGCFPGQQSSEESIDKKEETDLGATNDGGGYQERRYSQDSNEYVSMYQSGAS